MSLSHNSKCDFDGFAIQFIYSVQMRAVLKFIIIENYTFTIQCTIYTLQSALCIRTRARIWYTSVLNSVYGITYVRFSNKNP